ncbi:MAG: hypothetical protein AB1330_01035 [Bacillota bacterium]
MREAFCEQADKYLRGELDEKGFARWLFINLPAIDDGSDEIISAAAEWALIGLVGFAEGWVAQEELYSGFTKLLSNLRDQGIKN